ncbi:hypothetical protein ACPWR0_09385 [Pandoraea pneumonica]|uniref:hypothetical protein n=1 Tax=Pandoraea pneumonica TaxID=2508299 RepID=UPI003CF3D579
MTWTLMLVANVVAALALPAQARVPRRRDDDSPRHDFGPDVALAVSMHTASAAPSGPANLTRAWPDVIVEPVSVELVKHEYSVDDILKGIASGRAPFRNLGESIADAYTALTGNEVDADVREQLRKGTVTADLITSMLPTAALGRLTGEVAQILAEQHAGKTVESSRLTSVLLNTNLRGMASHSGQSGPRRAPTHHELSFADEETPAEPVSDTLREASKAQEVVTGEHAHLQGYAQPLPDNALHGRQRNGLEGDDTPQGIIIAGGNYFIRGSGGYYRMQHQKSSGQWLVDAPDAGRPQVPVTYDVSTGKWRASAALRLCGGGCGSSKASSQLSSTDDSMLGLTLDLSSIREPEVRHGIQSAFDDLSELHLLRTNRDDLRPRRDNSIVDVRASLSNGMRRIDRHAPLVEQQRQAAKCTALYYLEHPDSEAFCQENAEVLFHFMLANGVPPNRIRMITLRPRNRPPHVMVLYTESKHVIQMLHWATPQPPVDGRTDGITDLTFAQEIFATRESTRLLDPWGRTKMQTFEWAQCEHDVLDALQSMLEDAGARNGEPFAVSITRPLGTPRTSSSSLSSSGSTPSRNQPSGSSAATSKDSA